MILKAVFNKDHMIINLDLLILLLVISATFLGILYYIYIEKPLIKIFNKKFLVRKSEFAQKEVING